MTERPLVGNAADPKQVKDARKRERTNREGELEDVRAILDTPAGKRFLWRLLDHCKISESVFSPSAHIYYNSGMQDVGHFVLGEIMEAQPQAYMDMIVMHNKEKLNND
jgi:hypothetical protein